MKPVLTRFTLAVLVGLALGLSRVLGASPNTLYLPLVACPGCQGAPTTTPDPTLDPSIAVARLIELVNQARTAAGCPAVKPNTALMQGAQDWTNHMVTTSDYTHTPANYYIGYGYPTGTSVENIDGGAPTADLAFEDWMASAPHKANIEFCLPPEDPSYTPTLVYDIGVGYASPGYWTLAIGVRQP